MEFNTFESIKIGLASPERIREWSYGAVTRPETITAAIALKKPQIMNARIFVFCVFTPETFAAASLPPVARR